MKSFLCWGATVYPKIATFDFEANRVDDFKVNHAYDCEVIHAQIMQTKYIFMTLYLTLKNDPITKLGKQYIYTRKNT